MNLVKTLQRTLLNIKAVDAGMRISMHKDTIDIFEAEKVTKHFAKNHDLCDWVQEKIESWRWLSPGDDWALVIIDFPCIYNISVPQSQFIITSSMWDTLYEFASSSPLWIFITRISLWISLQYQYKEICRNYCHQLFQLICIIWSIKNF